MTSKPDDLKEVAEKFMDLPVDKFLFTKLDETATYGAALNLLYQYRKPLSVYHQRTERAGRYRSCFARQAAETHP